MANRKRPKMVSASKIYDSSEGVWRTIGGRRVFIRKGQSLSDAMKESGKFKRKGYTNEDYQKQENNIAQLKREYNALLDEEIDYQKDWDISEDPSPELEMTAWEREAKEEALREAQNKYREMEKNPYVERKYGVNKQELSNLKGKHIAGKQDKFYTRKDGTKEYDPYKGTRFEKKYDSVEDALNDPNHLTRKYIDKKFKIKMNEEKVRKNAEDDIKFYLDGNSENWDSDGDFIRELANEYGLETEETKKMFNDIKRTNLENKLEKEAGVRTFADDIALMDRYKGTYEHLQKTTNMSGAEILELLKKIDEDKK